MSVRVQAAMLFFVCLHLQANEAFLAPIGPPRIFDVPVTVLCALGFLVSCERHRMIHLELALTSMGGVAVDPAHVECPARGVHRHNYRRASLDKRLPQWLELVRGQERVAGNSEPDLGEDCVVAGHLGSAAGFVAPLDREGQTALADHVERELGSCTVAAALAAAVPRVWGARHHRLGRQCRGVVGGLHGLAQRLHHLGVGLHVALEHRGRGLGPAGAAAALVADQGPEAAGQVLDDVDQARRLLRVPRAQKLNVSLREAALRPVALVAEHGLVFMVFEVHELGNAHRP
mmetsp:Transcript_29694/g.85230  ORF Transcript_29694/g.85230 Transcript_29694/m.85230 type:complete len:289 (-) Transcript_29694:311-1177(-)